MRRAAASGLGAPNAPLWTIHNMDTSLPSPLPVEPEPPHTELVRFRPIIRDVAPIFVLTLIGGFVALIAAPRELSEDFKVARFFPAFLIHGV